jgi:hypothetical protein
MTTSSVWAINGAANVAAPNYLNLPFLFAPILMVQLAKLHQYIGARDMVSPIYWYIFACCTNRQRNTKIL